MEIPTPISDKRGLAWGQMDRSQVWPQGESSALGEGEHAGKGGEEKDVVGG